MHGTGAHRLACHASHVSFQYASADPLAHMPNDQPKFGVAEARRIAVFAGNGLHVACSCCGRSPTLDPRRVHIGSSTCQTHTTRQHRPFGTHTRRPAQKRMRQISDYARNRYKNRICIAACIRKGCAEKKHATPARPTGDVRALRIKQNQTNVHSDV